MIRISLLVSNDLIDLVESALKEGLRDVPEIYDDLLIVQISGGETWKAVTRTPCPHAIINPDMLSSADGWEIRRIRHILNKCGVAHVGVGETIRWLS